MIRFLTRLARGAGLAALALAAALAAPASAAIVINEIDYDQPGTDAAEFIELKNTGPAAVDITGYFVQLVNGSGGGAVVYQTITIPAASLAAGAYYVICANGANTILCDLDVAPNTDLVQNGSPDGVGLRDATGALVDAVSYEGNTGAPYTEGTGLVASDTNTDNWLGISRFPDGADTNNNNVDWSLRCISPGKANLAENTVCELPVPTRPATWGGLKGIYR
jgi:hypothetical protein